MTCAKPSLPSRPGRPFPLALRCRRSFYHTCMGVLVVPVLVPVKSHDGVLRYPPRGARPRLAGAPCGTKCALFLSFPLRHPMPDRPHTLSLCGGVIGGRNLVVVQSIAIDDTMDLQHTVR